MARPPGLARRPRPAAEKTERFDRKMQDRKIGESERKPYRLSAKELRFVLERARIEEFHDPESGFRCWVAHTKDGRRTIASDRYKKDLLPAVLFRLESEEDAKR